MSRRPVGCEAEFALHRRPKCAAEATSLISVVGDALGVASLDRVGEIPEMGAAFGGRFAGRRCTEDAKGLDARLNRATSSG